MRYIYDYLYLSLAFLAVIAFRFFSQRQFPSLRNKIFSVIIIVSFFDLILDILSSLVIERAAVIPIWVTELTCYLFYTLQMIFPCLLLAYVHTLNRRRNWLRFPRILLLILPAALTLLFLYSNLFTKLIFYVDPIDGYIHAPLFILLYVSVFLYLGLTLFSVIISRKEIIPIEFRTVIIFVIIISTMILVQYMMPRYLVSGAAISLALILMYIVMQKPEDMLDPVSGAFNQSALLIFAQNHIDEHLQMNLIVLELLYMRRINRLFGTDFGSKALLSAANEMRSAGSDGWLFRSTGNIFLMSFSSREAQARAYEHLCERFDNDIDVNGTSAYLTTTILSIPDTGALQSLEDLSECIESVLNTTPRGEHSILPPEKLFSDRRRQTVEDALVGAVKDDSLTIALQPIYSLAKKRFVTAEALARFHHETLGEVSPAEFIPIAEKNGLILQIDMQVIRKVCLFLQQHGDEIDTVEINLSPVEFINESLCTRIIETVKKFDIDPSKIVFELTETSVNSDQKLLRSSMSQLCSAGFRFALDDYGIGYSNISRIINLPFTLVKLDRSMLLASMRDKQLALVMKSTVQMLKSLELKTLVEGVENKEQADAMRELGVDFIQGFYYARPMTPPAALEVLSNSVDVVK